MEVNIEQGMIRSCHSYDIQGRGYPRDITALTLIGV